MNTGSVALADLHVHVARAGGRMVKVAASPRLTVEGIIDECVRRKGLDAVGIVDAHSPPVLEELDGLVRNGELGELGGGGLRRGGPRPLLVVPAVEVEVVEPEVGRVHLIAYLPTLEAARAVGRFLAGRVTNVVLSSQRARATGEEVARLVAAEGGFVVPAHVFTPHRGFFGQGGRDLRQMFSDAALEAVPAVELGLSADSSLADLVPGLEDFTYLTSSDAHSPESIAREHTAFNVGPSLDFKGLTEAVRRGEVAANYGLDPRLGKYHRAWCPRCGEVAVGRVCPECGCERVVGGVLDRIKELSAGAAGGEHEDREGRVRRRAGSRPPYVHIVPLRFVPGVGPRTYRRLLETFGSEMAVLHRVPEEDLAAEVGGRLASRIARARSGTLDLDIVPGAGGRYGRVQAFEDS